MFIRTMVLSACLALVACGREPRQQTAEERAFVERVAPYCGQADPDPVRGDRACYALLVMKDGTVQMLGGVTYFGAPAVIFRGYTGDMFVSVSYPDMYDGDKIVRIVGPLDNDYPATLNAYLTQQVHTPVADDQRSAHP